MKIKTLLTVLLLLVLLGGCAHGPVKLTLSKLRIGYFDDKTEWNGSSYYTQEHTYGIVFSWAADDWYKQKEEISQDSGR